MNTLTWSFTTTKWSQKSVLIVTTRLVMFCRARHLLPVWWIGWWGNPRLYERDCWGRRSIGRRKSGQSALHKWLQPVCQSWQRAAHVHGEHYEMPKWTVHFCLGETVWHRRARFHDKRGSHPQVHWHQPYAEQSRFFNNDQKRNRVLASWKSPIRAWSLVSHNDGMGPRHSGSFVCQWMSGKGNIYICQQSK